MTNDITTTGATGEVRISSREIAEIFGKRHDNVMRDIREMLTKLGQGLLNFEGTYSDPQNGQEYPCFLLPPREALILGSGYDVVRRAKLIDRLHELEGHVGNNVHFLVPKTLPEALRLAADLADKVEEQSKKIAVLEPKAEFHDKVAEAINCHTVQEVAKVLGTGQNRLFKWLRDNGFLMANNQPYQAALNAGHFRMVERQYNDQRGESHTYTRTLITGKGLAYIQKRYSASAA